MTQNRHSSKKPANWNANSTNYRYLRESLEKSTMLKEVGASGQISLGEKHAKRVIEVVPQSSTVSAQPTNVRSGWLHPGGYTTCNQWASENRDALITYADRISEQGTPAEQLHEFLAHPVGLERTRRGGVVY